MNMDDVSYLSEKERATLAGLDPAAKALVLKMTQETAKQERTKMKIQEGLQAASDRKRRLEVLDRVDKTMDEEWIKKAKQSDEDIGVLAEGVKMLKGEMEWLTKKQVKKGKKIIEKGCNNVVFTGGWHFYFLLVFLPYIFTAFSTY